MGYYETATNLRIRSPHSESGFTLFRTGNNHRLTNQLGRDVLANSAPPFIWPSVGACRGKISSLARRGR